VDNRCLFIAQLIRRQVARGHSIRASSSCRPTGSCSIFSRAVFSNFVIRHHYTTPRITPEAAHRSWPSTHASLRVFGDAPH
jgi:hypothetical protein